MQRFKGILDGLHGDLTELADRISAMLDCPITIEDANHRLLSYSVHENLSDTVRISTIMNRRVPEKIINSLWKEGYIPALLKSESPVIIPSLPNTAFGKRAAVTIKKNQEILGFIWALETNRTFTEDDLEFLQYASKEAKNQLLQSQGKKKRLDQSKQEFVWQCLTGHFDKEEDFESFFKKLAIPVPSAYTIILFQFPIQIDDQIEKQIEYMLKTTQIIHAPLYTIDRDQLIIIASPCDDRHFITALSNFISHFSTAMETRFLIGGIKGACGQPYDSLLEAGKCHKEAVYALELQQIFPERTEQLINFAELGMYQYLETLAGTVRDSLYQKRLDTLEEYDRKNKTNLLLTLATYLENDGNPVSTAKEMHLHVNTIHYRIKRMDEIMDISIKQPLHKMALYLEILLKQYIHFQEQIK